MSQVRVSGNASGTGILTVTSPNTNSNYTLTLPANTGTLVTNATAGTVLQVLQTVKSDTFSASPGQNTWVDVTGLSVSITPTSSSNKILCFVDVACGSSNYSTGTSVIRLVRGSTPIYYGDTAGARAQGINSFPYMADAGYNLFRYSGVYLDSPATTSATTYKYQISGESTGYTVYVNTNAINTNRWEDIRVASSITVMEIAA